MLPTQHRLRRAADILRVYRSRQRIGGQLLTLRLLSQQARGSTRFGFVVSRRVSKKATERNRLTRQARACIAHVLPRLREGYDILVIAEKPFSAYDRGAVCQELLRLLQKAQLILP